MRSIPAAQLPGALRIGWRSWTLFAFPGTAIVELVIAHTQQCATSLGVFALVATAELSRAFTVPVFVGTATLRLGVGMLDNIAQHGRQFVEAFLVFAWIDRNHLVGGYSLSNCLANSTQARASLP